MCVVSGLTNSIFDVYICRDIGLDQAVLAVDYTIDCGSSYYTALVLFGTVLVVLWPFGLPLFLLYKLWDAREDILAEDKHVIAQYDFVLADYKTEFFYWCVDSQSLCLDKIII